MCFLIKDMIDILLLFNANLEGLCLTRLGDHQKPWCSFPGEGDSHHRSSCLSLEFVRVIEASHALAPPS